MCAKGKEKKNNGWTNQIISSMPFQRAKVPRQKQNIEYCTDDVAIKTNPFQPNEKTKLDEINFENCSFFILFCCIFFMHCY